VPVVLDADCLIAGTLASRGACAELLDRWQGGEFELIVCEHLLGEVQKALDHPRIAGKYGLTRREISDVVDLFRRGSLLMPDPADPRRAVPDDPNDDYLVALAIDSQAEALVTRDRHFEKVRIDKIEILTPGRFLRRLG
jgi:putative PIN family toxin of toxin-antitoxin system